MTAWTILMPGTPMLFQGQEFASSSRFLFFADHGGELAQAVRKGRAEFLRQFPSIATAQMQAQLDNPADRATFERCKLDSSERDSHAEAYHLHRDLIKLRREDPALRAPRRGDFDGAVLGAEAFVLRFFHGDGKGEGDRLLLVNLGNDLHLDPAPEPLLAPPAGMGWQVLWSSEDARYGGLGIMHPDTDDNWRLTGQSAVLLSPGPLP